MSGGFDQSKDAGDRIPESSSNVDDDVPVSDRRGRLIEAAYAAEFATGRRERTRVAAKRNIVVRIVILVVGGLVLLAGLGMLIFPGPGVLVTLVGLGILAREFEWAARLLATMREKSHVDQVGKLPIWAQIALGLVSMIAVVAGLAWLLFVR